MKNLKKLGLTVFLLLGTTFICSDAFATERMEWGERDTSYSGSTGYNRTISGATWYYYTVPKDYNARDSIIQVPFTTDYGNKTDVAVNTCKSYGGFWALLRNEYNRDNYNQDAPRSSLTGKPAATTTLGEIYIKNQFEGIYGHVLYVPNDEFAAGEIGDAKTFEGLDDGRTLYTISATKRGNWDEVAEAFKKVAGTDAVPAKSRGKDGRLIAYQWNTASELSYFCSTPPGSTESVNYTKSVHRFSTVSMGYDDASAVASADYATTSKPVMDGVSFAGTNYTVPRGTTIRISFNHYLALEDDVDKIDLGRQVTTNWSQTGQSGSGGSATVSFGDINDRETWEYLYPGYLTTQAAQSDEIKVTVNSDMQICQYTSLNGTIGYSFRKTGDNYEFTYQDGQTPQNSGACVTLKPMDTSFDFHCTNVEGKAVPDANYSHNEHLGNTVGIAGVRKNSDPIQYTSGGYNSSEVTVYAKPGDAIRFYHSICFGANEVKSYGSGILGTYITGVFTQNNNISSVFNISNNEGNYAFMFGRADALMNRDVYVMNQNMRGKGVLNQNSFYKVALKTNTRISIDKKYIYLNNAEREIGLASPDQVAQKNYSADYTGEYECAFYSSLLRDSYNNSAADKSTGMYRVPGLQSSTALCNSSYIRNKDRVFQSSIVGSTLSQTLTYRYVAAWPSKVILPNGSVMTLGTGSSNCTGSASDYDRAYNALNNGARVWSETIFKRGKNGRLIPAGTRYAPTVCSNDGQRIQKTANVTVPYNFNTVATATINSNSDILYPGDVVKSSYQVDITPRTNPVTSDKEGDTLVPYATITPPETHVDVVEFVVRDTVDVSNGALAAAVADNNNGKNGWPEFGAEGASGDICSFYRRMLGDNIPFGGCQETIVKGQGALSCSGENCETAATRYNVGNNMSNPLGESGYYKATMSKLVPDIEAGYKYCTAVGINYGDSHGFPNQDLSADKNAANFGGNEQSANSYGMGANPLPYWHISAASCKSIAKKPNFQVWNAGTYSAGVINASITKKVASAILGEPEKYDGGSKQLQKPEYYFGSWDEYYVVSNKEVTNFASGSALGYNGDWLNTAGGVTTNYSNYCRMSRLTISNRECQNGVAGKSGVVDEDANASILVERLLTRYTSSSSPGLSPSDVPDINDSEKYTILSGFTASSYIKINGDYTLNQPITQSSGTRIIQVDGHLTINQNICLGEPNEADICQNPYGKNTNNLSLDYRNLTSYNNVAAVPQVLIIADSIGISGEVSQIDAWLITADLVADVYQDGGFVNTCDNYVDGKTGTDDCWRTLKLNGPIITSALLLNRTGGSWPGLAGDIGNPLYENTDVGNESVNKYIISYEKNPAGEWIPNGTATKSQVYQGGVEGRSTNASSRDLTCDGSITPAEIFDLHPMVYFWAYYQAQRTQTPVTYIREVAPRY